MLELPMVHPVCLAHPELLPLNLMSLQTMTLLDGLLQSMP
jgi:hypothetical protein